MRKLREQTEEGPMYLWDILDGPIPADAWGFSEGTFIISNIDSTNKCTTDLFDCFGLAIIGISKDTRKLISGIAHINIPTLQREGGTTKDIFEKTLARWLRKFMGKTEDKDEM